MHFLHKTFSGTIDKTSHCTVPSFTALAVLFPDCQKLTYVKQQNVALPLKQYFKNVQVCQSVTQTVKFTQSLDKVHVQFLQSVNKPVKFMYNLAGNMTFYCKLTYD